MTQVAAWFQRKFEFTFPVEQFPNLCVRLRGTPARMEEILRDCTPEKLIRKEGQAWSIQEQAGHLLDLESLWTARVSDFETSVNQLTAADLTNRKTHEAGHNDRDVKEILREFRKARVQLVDRAANLTPEAFSRTILHTRLQQPMRVVDHLHFAAEHDDHHLARIWEMLTRQA